MVEKKRQGQSQKKKAREFAPSSCYSGGEDSPLLVWLADHMLRIRERYIEEYRLFVSNRQGYDPKRYGKKPIVTWDGGTDWRTGRKYKSVWLKIARFAASNKVSPFDLITGAMRSWPSSSRAPFPNQIASQRALDLSSAYRETTRRSSVRLLLSAVERLETAIYCAKACDPQLSDGDAAVDVLFLGPGAKESALARLAVAYIHQLFSGRFKGARPLDLLHPAAAEYLQAPDEYDSCLTGCLPEDFKEYVLGGGLAESLDLTADQEHGSEESSTSGLFPKAGDEEDD